MVKKFKAILFFVIIASRLGQYLDHARLAQLKYYPKSVKLYNDGVNILHL
jgi:hypothetical protein